MKQKWILQWICVLVVSLMGIAGCKNITMEEQRSTATVFEQTSMLQAKEAAETGALVFCNIDFEKGKEAYKTMICEVTTTLGCNYLSSEIDNNWDALVTTYDTDALECEFVSSELIEESTQFGFPVQIWFVRLVGTVGWQDQTNRDYWLQVANESGEWKLNRVLSLTEIQYYKERYQD